MTELPTASDAVTAEQAVSVWLGDFNAALEAGNASAVAGQERQRRHQPVGGGGPCPDAPAQGPHGPGLHRQDVFIDQELVAPEFARGVREICDRVGAMVINHDLRCGARIDLRGGWAAVGVKPDLSAWSKSLANGYPLAALLGTTALGEAAAAVMATGSFWYSAAPMAAALTTIRLLKEGDGIERMPTSGLRLQEGLRAQSQAHDLAVSVSGPPQMPLMLFADDPEFAISPAWSGACAAHGVDLHPVHNWFLNAAHDEVTIDEVLERTDVAFDEVRDRFGAG